MQLYYTLRPLIDFILANRDFAGLIFFSLIALAAFLIWNKQMGKKYE